MANKLIVIICECGNSRAVREEDLMANIGKVIFCNGLTKDFEKCFARWTCAEILDKTRGGETADFSEMQYSLINKI